MGKDIESPSCDLVIAERHVAAISDTLFPDAKAVRKRVLEKRSLSVDVLVSKRSDCSNVRTLSRDHLGTSFLVGGRERKKDLLSNLKSRSDVSILNPNRSGRDRAQRYTRIVFCENRHS